MHSATYTSVTLRSQNCRMPRACINFMYVCMCSIGTVNILCRWIRREESGLKSQQKPNLSTLVIKMLKRMRSLKLQLSELAILYCGLDPYLYCDVVYFYRKYDITGLECNDPKMSMKLVFHAIIPLPFWEWDDKSRIFMRFGHSKLGEWEVNCHGEFKTRYDCHHKRVPNHGILTD